MQQAKPPQTYIERRAHMTDKQKKVDDGEDAKVQTPSTADGTNDPAPPDTDPGTIHSDRNPPPPEQP
jgi:hypothetical protein